jgi:hypothetical protein
MPHITPGPAADRADYCSETAFALDAERAEIARAGEMVRSAEIALKAAFSRSAPDLEEKTFLAGLVGEMAGRIYARGSFFAKLKLRYILSLC